eukprot:347647-Alexandrium_andersonii.AAC.1
MEDQAKAVQAKMEELAQSEQEPPLNLKKLHEAYRQAVVYKQKAEKRSEAIANQVKEAQTTLELLIKERDAAVEE